VRVAWVTDDAPDRGHGGTGIRQSHLLEALARAHEVHLLSSGGGADATVAPLLASQQLLAKGRTWWPSTRAQRRLHDLWLAGPGGPVEVYLTRKARAALAAALAASGPFDLVVLEQAGLAPLARGRTTGTWVVTLQNIASARATQELQLADGRVRRWLIGREISNTRDLERRATTQLDRVCVVSDLDAAQLGQRCVVVPNGVDLVAFHPTPLPSAPTVVFTGTLSYAPNVDALTWFADTAWPQVLAARPDAELLVVGRLPVPEVVALNDRQGITVVADVPDVTPYLERSRAAVMPLRLGSGTRLKALEAMAAGRPVVATTIALEGLRITPGEQALVADDADGLAAAVLRVLGDDVLAAELADSARGFVEREHDWQAIGRDWVAVLEAAAAH
jgi:glycosyltransferase involved in cell wall biosynthesis